MPITIYGIKNCDTMKKARAFLDKKKVAYDFHDYKTVDIERVRLEGWAKKVGWETLLNRAGTTFKKLPDKDKDGITEKKAHRADAGAAVDDQAARAGTWRRQGAGRICAGRVPRRTRVIRSLPRDCGDFLPGAIRRRFSLEGPQMNARKTAGRCWVVPSRMRFRTSFGCSWTAQIVHRCCATVSRSNPSPASNGPAGPCRRAWGPDDLRPEEDGTRHALGGVRLCLDCCSRCLSSTSPWHAGRCPDDTAKIFRFEGRRGLRR